MKVDGLTNDEVKSHLQKYRLHTRRPSPSPQTGAPATQLVVLGGIWVPPEYATAGAPTLYGAHPNSLPQEFYTAAPPQQLLPQPPPPHQSALHHHHQLMHVYKTAPQKQRLPEYDVQGGSESIEDGKSESSSWKGESGENEGERKGLQYDEINGSDITLKF
ncbi:putative transcription factor MYB-HB-like family [Lupinus albus]|uniref:Putative transcription factor MYB-HB-like family n=1 Tax=Lupinus albus TaxID=3870 RepID=A0A6A4PJW7_LUPAL|nr:putative transcription factor MYB-HB-like family [Lupinus albus]